VARTTRCPTACGRPRSLRREYSIGRQEQDEYAVRSHQRAAAATEADRFPDEIVPITVKSRKSETVVDRDEHIRPDSSVEALAKLRPILGKDDPEATVTAGNASGQNDGAAICVMTSPEKAAELGLRPLARLVSWSVGGVPPKTMGIGPVPATAKALALAGVKLADVDLIELNEAFASQVLAVAREWGFTDADWKRTNVNGSGISRGTRSARPVAASSPPCCGRWSAATPGTAWRRGASAAGRASPHCSSGSEEGPCHPSVGPREDRRGVRTTGQPAVGCAAAGSSASSSMPRARSLRYRVVRPMPRRPAAADRFPSA